MLLGVFAPHTKQFHQDIINLTDRDTSTSASNASHGAAYGACCDEVVFLHGLKFLESWLEKK